MKREYFSVISAYCVCFSFDIKGKTIYWCHSLKRENKFQRLWCPSWSRWPMAWTWAVSHFESALNFKQSLNESIIWATHVLHMYMFLDKQISIKTRVRVFSIMPGLRMCDFVTCLMCHNSADVVYIRFSSFHQFWPSELTSSDFDDSIISQ